MQRALPHRIGGSRKRSLQSTNNDQKSLETVFSIAICRQSGDKWQSKTLFLRSSIVFTFLIGAGVSWRHVSTSTKPCINKAIYVMLMHDFGTFNILVPAHLLMCVYPSFCGRCSFKLCRCICFMMKRGFRMIGNLQYEKFQLEMTVGGMGSC